MHVGEGQVGMVGNERSADVELDLGRDFEEDWRVGSRESGLGRHGGRRRGRRNIESVGRVGGRCMGILGDGRD